MLKKAPLHVIMPVEEKLLTAHCMVQPKVHVFRQILNNHIYFRVYNANQNLW